MNDVYHAHIISHVPSGKWRPKICQEMIMDVDVTAKAYALFHVNAGKNL